MPALHLGSEGLANDGVDGKVGIGTATPDEALDVNGNVKAGGGGYMNGHLLLGNYNLWVDNNGKLRIKNGIPSCPTDGTIVGSQS